MQLAGQQTCIWSRHLQGVVIVHKAVFLKELGSCQRDLILFMHEFRVNTSGWQRKWGDSAVSLVGRVRLLEMSGAAVEGAFRFCPCAIWGRQFGFREGIESEVSVDFRSRWVIWWSSLMWVWPGQGIVWDGFCGSATTRLVLSITRISGWKAVHQFQSS